SLLLGLLEFVVDHGLEGLEGLGPRDEAAVDEERRRAHARAALERGLVVGVHGGLVTLGVERLAELVHVDAADLRGELLVLGAAELTLVLEEQLVVLPELLVAALAVDLARGLRGGVRLTVEVEGEVTPDDADLTLVRLEDLVDRREH